MAINQSWSTMLVGITMVIDQYICITTISSYYKLLTIVYQLVLQ